MFCFTLHHLFGIPRDEKNSKLRILSSEFPRQFLSIFSRQNNVGQKQFDPARRQVVRA